MSGVLRVADLDALRDAMLKGYGEPPEFRYLMSGGEYHRVKNGGEGRSADGIAWELELGLTKRAKRWKDGLS